MAIYKGLVGNEAFVRQTDVRVRIMPPVIADTTAIEFPEDVTIAFVQATNWFPNDLNEFEAITVVVLPRIPNVLHFRRVARAGLEPRTGWFSFEVDTMAAFPR